MQDLLQNLNIPSDCKIEKRLTKKQFIENFASRANEKKLLSSDVESITLEYLLNKNNISIQPFQDEEHDYSEIAFIKVAIYNEGKVKKIAPIIQNIPYPLIVLFTCKDKICINMAPKRINKNDSTKLVVEDLYFTKWIDLKKSSHLEKEFFKSLQIQNHSFIDFLSFYNSYLDKIIAFNASEYSQRFSVNEETKEKLKQISLYEMQISELKSKIKKRQILTTG